MPVRPEVQPARLWSDLMTLGAVGGTPGGGSMRPALSDLDRAGRELFVHWAREAGMSVTRDAIGNIFARREGTDPDAAPVRIGSHLDTQMPGGRFDGPLGVLAGLEVVRSLNRAGLPLRRPVEVVNWTNEEGARFQPGVMGSAVSAGLMPLDTALAVRDEAGHGVAGMLAATGQAGCAPIPAPVPHCYFELHIEQGPELEQTGRDIGLVNRNAAMCSGYVTIHGENGHTQTLAMSRRRNALTAAARLILAVENIGAEVEPEGMMSASVIRNWPNNRVNIPHRTELSWSVVHLDPAGRDAMVTRIEGAIAEIARDTGLRIEVEHRHHREPVRFDPAWTARAGEIAAEMGLRSHPMATLTAHDALSMAAICPTALVFVPCRDGLSHCEAEWCSPDQAGNGAALLARLVAEAAA